MKTVFAALTMAATAAFGAGTKPAAAEVFDIGRAFAEKETWEQNSVDFTVDRKGDGFRFASQKRDVVNCLDRTKVKFLGLPVMESKVYFGEEGVKRLELSLYNKGDAEDALDRGDFDALLEKAREALTGDGAKPEKVQRRQLRKGGLWEFRQEWPKRAYPAQLAWAYAEDRGAGTFMAEYVRVTVRAAEAPKAAKGGAATKGRSKTKTSVAKETNGDVWIRDVPMVDQGQKGYCAAATAERVLRYFGQEIDEHEFAQWAGTSAEGGTSSRAMRNALAELGRKYKLGFMDVIPCIGSVGDLEKMLVKYNQAAKKAGKPQVTVAQYTQGNVIDVGGLLNDLDAKTLKAAKMKDGSGLTRFSKNVRQCVDQGIPLCWSVTLGRYPEPEIPQARGGHMRMIIGYNDKKKPKEIIYTDSWGASHEKKSMPEDWAWTITDSLFYLKPNNR